MWRWLSWLWANPEPDVPDITATEAAVIKRLYRTGRYTQRALSEHFGVDQSQISRILSGERR